MSKMTDEETSAWIATLRPGDLVGIYSRDGGFIHTDKVKSITKAGRVRLAKGDLYNADGTRRGGGCYRTRRLGPAPAKEEDEVEERQD